MEVLLLLFATVATAIAGEVVLTPAPPSAVCQVATIAVSYPWETEALARNSIASFGNCTTSVSLVPVDVSVFVTNYLAAVSAITDEVGAIEANHGTSGAVLGDYSGDALMTYTVGFLSDRSGDGWISDWCTDHETYTSCNEWTLGDGTAATSLSLCYYSPNGAMTEAEMVPVVQSAEGDLPNVTYSQPLARFECLGAPTSFSSLSAVAGGWQVLGTNDNHHVNILGPVSVGTGNPVHVVVFTWGSLTVAPGPDAVNMQAALEALLAFESTNYGTITTPIYRSVVTHDCMGVTFNDSLPAADLRESVSLCDGADCSFTTTLFPTQLLSASTPTTGYYAPRFTPTELMTCEGAVGLFSTAQSYQRAEVVSSGVRDVTALTALSFNSIEFSSASACERTATAIADTLSAAIEGPTHLYVDDWRNFIPWVGLFFGSGFDISGLIKTIKSLENGLAQANGGISQVGDAVSALSSYVSAGFSIIEAGAYATTRAAELTNIATVMSIGSTRIASSAADALSALVQLRSPGRISASDQLTLGVIQEVIEEGLIAPEDIGLPNVYSFGLQSITGYEADYSQPNAALWQQGWKQLTQDAAGNLTLSITTPFCLNVSYNTWLIDVNPAGFSYVEADASLNISAGVYEDLSKSNQKAWCVCPTNTTCYSTYSVVTTGSGLVDSAVSVSGRRQVVSVDEDAPLTVLDCAATVAGVNPALLDQITIVNSDNSTSFVFLGPLQYTYGQLRGAAVAEVASCTFKVANGARSYSLACDGGSSPPLGTGEHVISTVGLGTCVFSTVGLNDFDASCHTAIQASFAGANKFANGAASWTGSISGNFSGTVTYPNPQTGEPGAFNNTAQQEEAAQYQQNTTNDIRHLESSKQSSSCAVFSFWLCEFPSNILEGAMFFVFIIVMIIMVWLVVKVASFAVAHTTLPSHSTAPAVSVSIPNYPADKYASTEPTQRIGARDGMRQRVQSSSAGSMSLFAPILAAQVLPSAEARYIHSSDDARDVAGEVISFIVLAYLSVWALVTTFYVMVAATGWFRRRRNASTTAASQLMKLAGTYYVCGAQQARLIVERFNALQNVQAVLLESKRVAADPSKVNIVPIVMPSPMSREESELMMADICSATFMVTTSKLYTDAEILSECVSIARRCNMRLNIINADFLVGSPGENLRMGANARMMYARIQRNVFVRALVTGALVSLAGTRSGVEAARFEYTDRLFDAHYFGDPSSGHDPEDESYVRITTAIFIVGVIWIGSFILSRLLAGFGEMRSISLDVRAAASSAWEAKFGNKNPNFLRRGLFRTYAFWHGLVVLWMATPGVDAAIVPDNPSCGYWDWSGCAWDVWIASICTVIVMAYLAYKVVCLLASVRMLCCRSRERVSNKPPPSDSIFEGRPDLLNQLRVWGNFKG